MVHDNPNIYQTLALIGIGLVDCLVLVGGCIVVLVDDMVCDVVGSLGGRGRLYVGLFLV
jgi:hypothetical protein